MSPRRHLPRPLRDPKRDQVQLASHASCLNLVAEALFVISGSQRRYPSITKALLARCGGADMVSPVKADFPPVVVSEAARAINMQEAARATSRFTRR